MPCLLIVRAVGEGSTDKNRGGRKGEISGSLFSQSFWQGGKIHSEESALRTGNFKVVYKARPSGRIGQQTLRALVCNQRVPQWSINPGPLAGRNSKQLELSGRC